MSTRRPRLEGICPFTEVARYYYPTRSTNAAARALRQYIESHKELQRELQETGYDHHTRELSPKQIAILKRRLDPAD